MSDVAMELVSWDNFENQGKIEGSEWVCPQGSIDDLGALEKEHGSVSDEDVLRLAQGRWQHLELTESPDGFHAVQIVDTETGQIKTGERDSYRYNGLITCGCGTIHDSPSVASAFSGDTALSLGNNRHIAGVYNYDRGTETTVRPNDPNRKSIFVQVTPTARELVMLTNGSADNALIDGSYSSFEIRGRGSKPEFDVVIGVSDTTVYEDGSESSWGHLGQIDIALNGLGKVTSLKAYKDFMLNLLAVQPANMQPISDEWAQIPFDGSTTGGAQEVLDALAEVLGHNRWGIVDLATSAKKLYETIGNEDFEPIQALTFLEA